ncbi:MAG TPA: response regulator, partial [Chloroflexota bacterium]|nr:response regulator [Chloroflexota bacterium]
MARARVLVADDSQTSLALVRDFLERSGYEVVTARDGLEAIEAVYRENPDLVVLDVVMPRMTGYQVCRMLKLDEQTQHIPVVMLTSRDQPADQYWGLQTGADCYVT